MKRIISVLCLTVIVFFGTQAADYDQLQKLVASERTSSDKFGNGVSIDGDYAAVAAYYEDEDAAGANTLSNAGAVYIFKRDGSTWSQQAKLVPFDRQQYDDFGYSVAISGDYVIIGAAYEDHDTTGSNELLSAGSAYIFKRNGSSWEQQIKLVSSDRAGSDYFGYSVALDGDYAIVGAYQEDEDTTGSNTLNSAGSAYIFKRDGSNWVQQAKLVSSDRAAADYFGRSVSLSGDYVLIGAYGEDEDVLGNNTLATAGAAYVFKRDGNVWNQEAKIVASDRGAGDEFGYSTSIDEDYVFIGAYKEDEDASGGNSLGNAGSAYVFKRSGTNWVQEAKLVASDRALNDYFGNSISIYGSYALVGAYSEDEDTYGSNTLTGAGSAYIFKREGTSWSQESKIVPDDRDDYDNFGCSVTLDGTNALIGANQEDEDATGANTVSMAGSAYIFEIPASEVPLPIMLSSFKVKASGGKIELNWRTESETNNAYFVIYRNGEPIGSAEGVGTTTEPQEYTFVDANVIPGVTYTYMIADVDYGNVETRYENESVTITLNENIVIEEFDVSEAYPNPFNPTTAIDYSIFAEASMDRQLPVNLSVYNLTGHKVRTLVNSIQETGYYTVQFHAGDLPSGVYIYRLSAGAEVRTMKMILMK